MLEYAMLKQQSLSLIFFTNIQMIPIYEMKLEKYCFWGIEYLMSCLSFSLYLSLSLFFSLYPSHGYLIGLLKHWAHANVTGGSSISKSRYNIIKNNNFSISILIYLSTLQIWNSKNVVLVCITTHEKPHRNKTN